MDKLTLKHRLNLMLGVGYVITGLSLSFNKANFLEGSYLLTPIIWYLFVCIVRWTITGKFTYFSSTNKIGKPILFIIKHYKQLSLLFASTAMLEYKVYQDFLFSRKFTIVDGVEIFIINFCTILVFTLVLTSLRIPFYMKDKKPFNTNFNHNLLIINWFIFWLCLLGTVSGYLINSLK